MNGKYDSKNTGPRQSPSHPPSRFERETLHRMKQMCAASADENGFVMNYDEAYNLTKETYGGSMQITEDFKITNWQAASHLYHGKGVGVNPEDFGISQTELDKIREGGFINFTGITITKNYQRKKLFWNTLLNKFLFLCIQRRILFL